MEWGGTFIGSPCVPVVLNVLTVFFPPLAAVLASYVIDAAALSSSSLSIQTSSAPIPHTLGAIKVKGCQPFRAT